VKANAEQLPMRALARTATPYVYDLLRIVQSIRRRPMHLPVVGYLCHAGVAIAPSGSGVPVSLGI
jgi:hypothetical protein